MNVLDFDDSIEKWRQSASAWIKDQGDHGDWSRRAIIDPVLEKVFSEVYGMKILDVGCGQGRYCRMLSAKGATVTGLDPVTKFIEHAQELDDISTYIQGNAEALPFENDSFDIVLSYLSFIDIQDLENAANEIARVIQPGGQLVVANISNVASTTDGWVKDETGKKLYRKVDRYMEHFSMDLNWRGINIRNYHRPLSYVLGLFLDKGFVLNQFFEPLPDSTDPNYQDEFRVPTFQIFTLEKRIP